MDCSTQSEKLPNGEIAYSLLLNPNIQFDLIQSKYQAVLDTFIRPNQSRYKPIIAGGHFTKYTRKPRPETIDIYVATEYQDINAFYRFYFEHFCGQNLSNLEHLKHTWFSMRDELQNEQSLKETLLNKLNEVLIIPAKNFYICDYGGIICQVVQSHEVTWIENNEKRTQYLTVQIRFVVEALKSINSLFDTFQLEPCKIAFREGKFYFSDWFVRGGSIIAKGHEPSQEFLDKYFEKGFDRTMNLGWHNYCCDIGVYNDASELSNSILDFGQKILDLKKQSKDRYSS